MTGVRWCVALAFGRSAAFTANGAWASVSFACQWLINAAAQAPLRPRISASYFASAVARMYISRYGNSPVFYVGKSFVYTATVGFLSPRRSEGTLEVYARSTARICLRGKNWYKRESGARAQKSVDQYGGGCHSNASASVSTWQVAPIARRDDGDDGGWAGLVVGGGHPLWGVVNCVVVSSITIRRIYTPHRVVTRYLFITRLRCVYMGYEGCFNAVLWNFLRFSSSPAQKTAVYI